MGFSTALPMKRVRAKVDRIDVIIGTKIDDPINNAVMHMEDETEAAACARQLPTGDVSSSPDILDELEAQGVCIELIDAQTSQEKRDLVPGPAGLGHADGPVFPQSLRHTTLIFFACVAEETALPQRSWSEASALLDMYHLKTQDPDHILPAITALPLTCAAVMLILKKKEDATVLVGGSSYIPYASKFAQNLQRSGYPTVNTEVTGEMINLQERRVLEALGWRIQVSTAESWASTFIVRLDVISSSLLKQSLQEVLRRSISGARLFMLQQAVSAEQPPRMLAAGLLGIGLVGARVLPLEAIQPDELSYEEWKNLYEEIQPQDCAPYCDLSRCHWQRLLNLVTLAVGADLSVLKQACHLASFAMREARHAGSDLFAAPRQ